MAYTLLSCNSSIFNAINVNLELVNAEKYFHIGVVTLGVMGLLY
ncbi:hypothetical protein ECHHL_0316 [Ehrlichia chaffeensis str. Heartland]|uniref:Uncharacterized protein n=1 Tax=Ehrlichia chaffeensis (strain ATCC CRL-10679 / Arkansas) TaxID=205920 RepID=Q2GH91_EHRCR|nr:hypothetical protein ECH_0372 [Ehrlichia chaffeensis str. Arkansas]AHX03481.1 hypothetical protein ECHHL_0316 [Ehrlichia chaffeensis str. Heartland]AHX05799.1 hypothetical protein ECHJAX_0742 [Ehrlichia chaffeensis str. Jax]AHX06791.1 hypothetical protein ECHLIB_0746 [Ehrlichia chaffeensis str. Liberty]AHX07578.1 hypothetical protein ECHOSC_0326 [Ehrlichia chaffeensis str. Osceola]AHX08719.1 hypothetical protein ECHSTV_0730 [Ehrlichia chaffeensis str. Saint Vincent]AHX09056.1 hypothetical 